jgi:hypothetical protein
MGVNHYLGTFDSEWDAAAIYGKNSSTAFVVTCNHQISRCSLSAWAHLILYGEEATKQAQKEGEEAAAAYEQEKRDIAAGKLPAAAPKPEKKKRKPANKKKSEGKEGKEDGAEEGEATEKTPGKKKRAAKDEAGGEKKKPRAGADKESIAPILAKSVSKVRFSLAVMMQR